MDTQQQGGVQPTVFGKLFSLVLIAGLVAVGWWVYAKKTRPQNVAPAQAGVSQVATATGGEGASEAENTKSTVVNEVPRFGTPGAYQMKDNTLDIELSEYLGYSGIIVANNGLAPSEDSLFFKKFGFKVRITLKEDESRGDVHTGRLGLVATTADVLACYGKDFNVVVPVQIGYSRGADGIVVTSDVMRVNQLKGRILSATQFSESEFFIRYLAQEAGIEVNYVKDLNETPNPEKINLFFTVDGFSAADLFLKEVKSGKGRLAGCVSWAPRTTEVIEQSGGKAKMLVTNHNLLLVADILAVNKPFAKANPKVINGLVQGVLEGNHMVRANPEAYLDLLMKAFNTGKKDPADLMTRQSIREELTRVHLSNLPENQTFFAGDISTGGSFAQIFSSSVLAYGSLVRDPVDADYYATPEYLASARQSKVFEGETAAILPIKSGTDKPLEADPLLSKDIRFFFQPNSSDLDMNNPDNLKNLNGIKQLLEVSPGSKVLLRGHVDNGKIEEFRRLGGEAMVRSGALEAMKLSKNRANEIRRLLIEQKKIDAARLETIGRGWEEPAGTDGEKNRRVEVYWYTLE